MATIIVQNGITLTFDTDYTYGQYITGDYWVVDPGAGITISSSTHSVVAGVNAGEGFSLNPRYGYQGYDSRCPGYRAGDAVTLPYTFAAGQTVVAVTHNTTPTGQGYYLYSAIIVTFVDEAQDTNDFRPPYCRPTRVADSSTDTLIFNMSDISDARWAWLPNESTSGVAGIPAISTTEAKIRGPWIDHLADSNCHASHPTNQQESYGRDFSTVVSEVAGQLCFNYTDTQLKSLAKYLIQVGIDTYGTILDGGQWHGDGGIASGRKFPFIFAATMLDSSAMKVYTRWDSARNEYRFAEDSQTYYYDDSDANERVDAYQGPADTYIGYTTPDVGRIALRGVKGWIGILNGGAGGTALWRICSYDVDQVAMHEHIPIASWPDNGGGSGPGKWEAYRLTCTSHTWPGQAMLMMLMGGDILTVWDHDAYFDYCKRWMSEDLTAAGVLYESHDVGIGNSWQWYGMEARPDFVTDAWGHLLSQFPTFPLSSSYPHFVMVLR